MTLSLFVSAMPVIGHPSQDAHPHKILHSVSLVGPPIHHTTPTETWHCYYAPSKVSHTHVTLGPVSQYNVILACVNDAGKRKIYGMAALGGSESAAHVRMTFCCALLS